MLKKIKVSQLTIGMHIKEFCGSWMEHPFWSNDFVIKNGMDINAIMASSITEVWIDTNKGVDASGDEPVITETLAQQDVDLELRQAAENFCNLAPVSLHQEIERAIRICEHGKSAVAALFQDVRMGRAIDSHDAQSLVEDITNSVSRNPYALISLARLKKADDYTFMHSVAVCALMVALAKQLKLDEQETRSCGLAGLFHDLGKALMPIEILNKPGKLTEDEFTIIKTHPRMGYELLCDNHFSDLIALDVVLHHHEKTDGSGYPDYLNDDQITLYAKMGAVCDVYDAITSDRPYKKGWGPADALHKMAEWANGHFDHEVFQAFVKSVGIYPTGSLVRLNSGRLAVVIEQGKKSLLTPRVKVFFSTSQKSRISPEVVDLSVVHCVEKIIGREDPTLWNFPDLNNLWKE
jgi:putative nucleotidyltransferase with HDIG domain